MAWARSCLVVGALMFGACAGTPGAAPSIAGASAASPGPASPSSPQPAPGEPSASLAGQAVRVFDLTDSQVELSVAGGPRVLIDVVDPARLSRPATSADVLLVTQRGADHFDPGFFRTFAGRKVLMKPAHFSVAGITVTSIPAARRQGDPMTAAGATDYIYVVDVGGLRIVDFGDLGQSALTPAQLSTIGRVDVAFSQLDNPSSRMNEINRKGFHQMEQVQPRLLIPTHMTGSVATARLAASTWPARYTTRPYVILTSAELPARTAVLFMALNAGFGHELGLPPCMW